MIEFEGFVYDNLNWRKEKMQVKRWCRLIHTSIILQFWQEIGRSGPLAHRPYGPSSAYLYLWIFLLTFFIFLLKEKND